jgi:MFS family permease
VAFADLSKITIYAPDMFALLGTKGQNEKLFATAIFGVVKFVSSILCALFIVDMLGRKRALSIGIALQAVSMAYIAAFLTAVPDIDEDTVFTKSQKAASTAGIVMIYISGVSSPEKKIPPPNPPPFPPLYINNN